MKSSFKTPFTARKRPQADDEGPEAQTPKAGYSSYANFGFLTARGAMTCIKQRPAASFDATFQHRKRASCGGGDAVKVFVRVKPVMEEDLKMGRATEAVTVCEKDDHRGIAIPALGGKEHWFSEFDGVLDNATNQQVFEAIRIGILPSFMQGTNATIMAYGQTGSGKTHTMFGRNEGALVQVQGLLHLVLNHIDQEVPIGAGLGAPYARLAVSVFEIYNEEVYSLLGEEGAERRLLGKSTAEYAAHALKAVSSVDEATTLVMEALQNRARDATARNSASSRSHAFVKIRLEQAPRPGDEHGTVSTLFLVDLAGSESIVHAKDSAQQRETIAINKSLNVLERVVNALSMLSAPGTSVPHIPYRDSLLTQVLQEGLSPWKARVALVATVSRFHQDIPVTKSTLMFAQRARNMRTFAQINYTSKRPLHTCPEDVAAQLQNLQASNNTLRQQLADLEVLQERNARQRQTALILAELQRQAEVHAELHRSAARQQQEAEAALEAERVAHAATRTQLSELQLSAAEQQQGLAAAREEARVAGRAAADVRAQVAELKLEAARLNGELAGARALAGQVQGQHKVAHEQLAQAKEQLTALKGKLAAAESGIDRQRELEGQVVQLHAEVDAVKSAASAEAWLLHQRTEELQQQLSAAQQQVARQQQELAQERDRSAQSQQQVAEVLQGSSEQILALQRRLHAAGEHESERAAHVQRLESELSRLGDALQAAEGTVQQLCSEAAAARDEAAARSEVCRSLEARLQGAHAEAEAREQQLAQQASLLSEELQATRGQLSERLDALAAAHEEQTALRAKLAGAEGQLKAAFEQLVDRDAQLAAAEEELAARQQRLQSVEEPLAAAQDQLAAAEAKHEAALAEAKRQLAALEEAKAESAALRQQLLAAQEARAAQEAAAAERIMPLTTECERLRATYALAEEQLARLESERERLREDVSAASERAARWEAEFTASRAAAQKVEAEAADRVAKLEAQLERDVAPRRDATKQLTDRIRQLEMEKKRAEEAHKGQMELKEKLIHQLELMVQQLQAEAAKARPDTAAAQASDQQGACSPPTGSAPGRRSDGGAPAENTPPTAHTASRVAAVGGMLLRTTGSAAALARDTRSFTPSNTFTAPRPPARPAGPVLDLVTPPHARGRGTDEAIDLTSPASVSPADSSLLDIVREQERMRPLQLNASTTAVRNKMNY